MKNYKILLTVCLIFGGSRYAGATPRPLVATARTLPAAAEPSLEGRWIQPCTSGSLRSEYFVGSNVALNEMYFADKDCRRPVVVFVNEGRFTLPQPGQINFEFTSVRLRLLSDGAANDFNKRKVCGFADWKTLEEREISGRSCEIFFIGLPQRIPTAGDMRFGIYRLNKDQSRLYFGKLSKDKNATTPEARPHDLDPRYYVKVPHVRPGKDQQ